MLQQQSFADSRRFIFTPFSRLSRVIAFLLAFWRVTVCWVYFMLYIIFSLHFAAYYIRLPLWKVYSFCHRQWDVQQYVVFLFIRLNIYVSLLNGNMDIGQSGQSISVLPKMREKIHCNETHKPFNRIGTLWLSSPALICVKHFMILL